MPINTWRNWGLERSSNLPKVITAATLMELGFKHKQSAFYVHSVTCPLPQAIKYFHRTNLSIGWHFCLQFEALMHNTVILHVLSCQVVSNSAIPRAIACEAPLSMGLPRQEYWNGLSFASPGDRPHPGIEPASPALAGGFFTTEPQEKPWFLTRYKNFSRSVIIRN